MPVLLNPYLVAEETADNLMKHKYFLTILALDMLFFVQAQTGSYKYDFGEGTAPAGFTRVTSANIYSPESGYGFDFNSSVTAKKTGYKNNVEDDYITSAKPFYSSVKLPEGNYNVNVILGDAKGISTTTIKAECRRLMVEKAVTEKGMFITKEFTVHVNRQPHQGCCSRQSKFKAKRKNLSSLG